MQQVCSYLLLEHQMNLYNVKFIKLTATSLYYCTRNGHLSTIEIKINKFNEDRWQFQSHSLSVRPQ